MRGLHSSINLLKLQLVAVVKLRWADGPQHCEATKPGTYLQSHIRAIRGAIEQYLHGIDPQGDSRVGIGGDVNVWDRPH